MLEVIKNVCVTHVWNSHSFFESGCESARAEFETEPFPLIKIWLGSERVCVSRALIDFCWSGWALPVKLDRQAVT